MTKQQPLTGAKPKKASGGKVNLEAGTPKRNFTVHKAPRGKVYWEEPKRS
jgi:hypothetical protein